MVWHAASGRLTALHCMRSTCTVLMPVAAAGVHSSGAVSDQEEDSEPATDRQLTDAQVHATIQLPASQHLLGGDDVSEPASACRLY